MTYNATSFVFVPEYFILILVFLITFILVIVALINIIRLTHYQIKLTKLQFQNLLNRKKD